jgi:hypothetical protein
MTRGINGSFPVSDLDEPTKKFLSGNSDIVANIIFLWRLQNCPPTKNNRICKKQIARIEWYYVTCAMTCARIFYYLTVAGIPTYTHIK